MAVEDGCNLLARMKHRSFPVLAGSLFALLLLNSAHFFFRVPYYELGDWAADSLSIDRAKHFAEDCSC